VIATRELPARPARYAELPSDLHPALREALLALRMPRLYSHQREAYDASRRGEHVVVTTGTASGKSLAFLLPVLQGLSEDPAARAILLYPTKALARDQLRGIERLIASLRLSGQAPYAGVYDGDTPPDERRALRERARLVLTNPDMLSSGLLPAHGRQGTTHLFRHVRWIVIDELHGYRGAFGAHVSNVIRRLLRICAHYRPGESGPRFLCSSATIANPGELAAAICRGPFTVIDRDGSPSSGKTIEFWQPPEVAPDVRRGAGAELASLLPQLVQQRQQTIAFCRSRKQTEVVLKEVRDRLRRVSRHHDESRLVAGYRAGYTPRERRRIERDLLSGKLIAVVSTNALELGIDIGQLEVVLQAGYPGTRASFWQQLGRAGRRGRRALGILILGQTPLDQYIARDPDWLVGQPTEHAVVDPDNLVIQLGHVRCAAAELPLTLDDAATWPDLAEIIPALEDAGELRALDDVWVWVGGPFPAGDISLRSSDRDRFKIVDRSTGVTLTEMTRPQVYKEAHTRAIYLHDGQQYQVEALDLVAHVATVVPVEQHLYTQPDVRTQIEVLAAHEQAATARVAAVFGDVRVDESIVGYKMLEFHNHQNLGYERLRQPLELTLETEAVWWPVPEDVMAVLAGCEQELLKGMVHAVRAAARLRTMAEPSDLVGTSFRLPDDPARPRAGSLRAVGDQSEMARSARTALVLYDTHPGGIGFAAKAFEFAQEILRAAIRLVAECSCRAGCPACTGDYLLDRARVEWGLASLVEVTPLPSWAASPADPQPLPSVASELAPWSALPEVWPAVRLRLAHSERQGARMLAAIQQVVVEGATLRLQVATHALASWLAAPAHQDALLACLGEHIMLPQGIRLEFEAVVDQDPAAARRAARTRHKLRHRLEDLARGEPANERAANHRLASGFVLPQTRALPAEPHPDSEGDWR
jgi:DEAD/DEAH box helicase domain-containing protein